MDNKNITIEYFNGIDNKSDILIDETDEITSIYDVDFDRIFETINKSRYDNQSSIGKDILVIKIDGITSYLPIDENLDSFWITLKEFIFTTECKNG